MKASEPFSGLRLALPKGRVLEEAMALFAAAGLPLTGLAERGRKLVHDVPGLGFRVLVVRDADVPTFVEHGAADVGIAGLDVLEEQARELYVPLDLHIGKCRLSVAEPVDADQKRQGRLGHLRYATKFPQLTQQHLMRTGVTAEIIKLHGAIELSVLTGLADRIVDLVQTGETLRENRLAEVEVIMDVTSRLVVNRAALKLERERIDEITSRLADAVKLKPGAHARAQRAGRAR